MLLFYPMDNEKYTNEAIWQTAIQSLHLSQARTNAIWSKLSNSSRGELSTAEKAPKGLLRKRKKTGKKNIQKMFSLVHFVARFRCMLVLGNWLAIWMCFATIWHKWCSFMRVPVNRVEVIRYTSSLVVRQTLCNQSLEKPILPQPINGNLQWNRRTLHLQGRAQSFVS